MFRANILAALALYVLLGAYPADAAGTTCAGVATAGGFPVCPAIITSKGTYNSAQSNQGSTLGPLDPYGPSNMPGSGVAGYCRYIYNTSSASSPLSIFVPFNSQQEWNSFLEFAPTNYGSASVATDTCSRPLLPATVASNQSLAVGPCCGPAATGQVVPCTLDPTSAVSYFVQPNIPALSGGMAGYSPTHVPGGATLETASATQGIAAAVGSGGNLSYPGVSSTGVVTGTPVAMTFKCTGSTGTWTQTAEQVQYQAGNSDKGISWEITSIAYSGSPSPPCGSANGSAYTSQPPSSLLCPAGATEINMTGGTTGPWTWNCWDAAGGAGPLCTAFALGQCGTAAAAAPSTTMPTTNLCLSTDTASAVSMNSIGSWSWTCTGPGTGGVPTQCADLSHGLCNPTATVSSSTAPTGTLCTTGTASPITGSGPWNWSCTGSDGVAVPCVDPGSSAPACGTASDTCVAGTPGIVANGERVNTGDGINILENGGGYIWSCTQGSATIYCGNFLSVSSQCPLNCNQCNSSDGGGNGAAYRGQQTYLIFGDGTQIASGEGSDQCGNLGIGMGPYYGFLNYGSIGGHGANCACPSTSSVNGVCSVTRGACQAGAASGVDGNGYWTCAGSGGGLTAYCNTPFVTNGVCGPTMDTCNSGVFFDPTSSVGYSYQPSSSYLASQMGYFGFQTDPGYPPSSYVYESLADCTTGAGTPVSPACTGIETNYPIGSTSYTNSEANPWYCDGINGGTSTPCTEPAGTVNGKCGTAPATCTPGTLVSGSAAISSDGYTESWTCAGTPTYGNSNSCTIVLNGECGSTKATCIYGTIADSKQEGHGWSWKCVGYNYTAPCSVSNSN